MKNNIIKVVALAIILSLAATIAVSKSDQPTIHIYTDKAQAGSIL